MGVSAIVTGLATTAVGLGLASMMNKQPNMPTYSSDVSYQNTVDSIPTVPEAPVAPDENGDMQKTQSMLAAEEEERRKRLAAAEANKTNYSGGLGLSTPASTLKTTLG